MSVMKRMSGGAFMASFCCALTGIAGAQQVAPATGQEQSEVSENVSDPVNPEANNRASQQQRDRAASERTGGELSNRANSRDSQAVPGGQNSEVEEYLAGCLLAKNSSEVELSQFAEKQSENPAVKKFAQMMIQDHQKMIQELKQLAGTQANTNRQADSTSDALSTDAGSQRLRNRVAENSTRNQVTPSAGDSTSRENGRRDARDRTTGDSRTAQTYQASPGTHSAIEQLAQIERQIVERQTQVTRDDLQQKSGVEFDKCFVGGAIVAHVHMIAALQVIEQQGQGQLAQAAKQARPVAEQHLEHAKQLMKQLESAVPKLGQAERQPSGTQR